jgi:hypothetical protein
MNVGKIEQLSEKKANPKLPTKPYMGDGSTAEMHDHPLTVEEILKRAVPKAKKILLDHGIEPKTVVSDFDRKAAFSKLAFWLREFGYDDDMARFIEEIALKRDFARDYRVEKNLLRKMVKMFKAAEKLYKPYVTQHNTITEYTSRFKALQKEVTSIRTIINRLLNTTYRRGTQRKLYGGTRSDTRGSPDSNQAQT